MNIVMMTNTYKPIVGGVEQSVERFTDEYRANGHDVLIVAPAHDEAEDEPGVVHVPAIQNFNGSDFSVPLPIPHKLADALDAFAPDIIHSHHPFLIGDTALRTAAKYDRPVVFTNHTLYEQYTHYVPFDSPAMQRFVISLATGYANLCDLVFAPSGSIADLLQERGVDTPVEVMPTGIDVASFREGDGAAFRASHSIPADSKVLGFVSRISPEKNIGFLAQAVASVMRDDAGVHFLMIGSGPSSDTVHELFRLSGIHDRLHAPGTLEGGELVDAYHAMDAFVYASKSETQGLVIPESMAAGVPVIGLDAPGVRDVVENGKNGLLVMEDSLAAFTETVREYLKYDSTRKESLASEARRTAEWYDQRETARRALGCYERLIHEKRRARSSSALSLWEEAKQRIAVEWNLMMNLTRATGDMVE